MSLASCLSDVGRYPNQATIHTTYAGPIGYMRSALALGVSQLAAFIKWISTPDEPPGADPISSSSSNGGSASRRARNFIN